MQQDDFILDENVDHKTNKLPPPIVSFERIFFLVLLISQYIALLQMFSARNMEFILGLFWAAGVHILLFFWQFFSALSVWREQGDRLRSKTILF